MQLIRKYFPIAAIILAGLILRLWNAGSMSLSNDELSALYRLQFDDLGTLWREGVRPDGHPAFVQTFLFLWLKIAPATPFFIRLPFILAGCCSILLVYLTGKKWFGATPGLFAAACMAFLEYPILYSQLARPYAFGLCFTLWMAWSWSRIVLQPPPYRWHVPVQAALAAALCFYTHYFSFFQALLIGISGFFFIRGAQWKYYIAVAASSLILFLPHLPLTRYQVSIGGVGGWLGRPGYDFPVDYLLYIFNYSAVIWAIAAAILCISLLVRQTVTNDFTRLRILSLTWFLVPLATGFYYSRHVNPVLQFSVLIFGWPFLLLFIFSFTERLPLRRSYLLLTIFSLFCVLHTATPPGRDYYRRYHFGEYKQLAGDLERWKAEYGSDLHGTALINNPFYLRYYLRENSSAVNRYYRKIPAQLIPFRRYVQNISSGYLSFGWTNQFCPPEIPEIIAEFYPRRMEEKHYLNAGSYLFTRLPGPPAPADTLQRYFNGFEQEMDPWNATTAFSDSSVSFSGRYSLLVGSDDEFGPSFETGAADLAPDKYNVLHVRAYVRCADSLCNPQLVLTVERDGKNIFWTSRQYDQQAAKPGWNPLYLSQRMDMDGFRPATDRIKVYLWNPGHESFYIDDMRIWSEKGNPILYGYDLKERK